MLAQITSGNLWVTGAALALMAVGITALVYGSVAALVKADDIGLRMAQLGHFALTRYIGTGIVKTMPSVLAAIPVIGTAAMLWVGGSIVIYGLEVLDWGRIGHQIHDIAAMVVGIVDTADAAFGWIVTAGLDGVFGLLQGLAALPVVTYLLAPVARSIAGSRG